jgi:hypothetical protein
VVEPAIKAVEIEARAAKNDIAAPIPRAEPVVAGSSVQKAVAARQDVTAATPTDPIATGAAEELVDVSATGIRSAPIPPYTRSSRDSHRAHVLSRKGDLQDPYNECRVSLHAPALL